MKLIQDLRQEQLITIYAEQSPLDYSDLLWALKATGSRTTAPELKDIIQVDLGRVLVTDRRRLHGFKLASVEIPNGWYRVAVSKKTKEIELSPVCDHLAPKINFAQYEANHSQRIYPVKEIVTATRQVLSATIALSCEGLLVDHQYVVDAFGFPASKTKSPTRSGVVFFDPKALTPARIQLGSRFAIIAAIRIN